MKALEFYSGIGGWSEALEEAMRRLGRGKEYVQVGGLVGGWWNRGRWVEGERNGFCRGDCKQTCPLSSEDHALEA